MRSLLLAAILLGGPPASAQEVAPVGPAGAVAVPDHLDRLIRELGSDDFHARERAQAELVAGYTPGLDPIVRERALKIAAAGKRGDAVEILLRAKYAMGQGALNALNKGISSETVERFPTIALEAGSSDPNELLRAVQRLVNFTAENTPEGALPIPAKDRALIATIALNKLDQLHPKWESLDGYTATALMRLFWNKEVALSPKHRDWIKTMVDSNVPYLQAAALPGLLARDDLDPATEKYAVEALKNLRTSSERGDVLRSLGDLKARHRLDLVKQMMLTDQESSVRREGLYYLRAAYGGEPEAAEAMAAILKKGDIVLAEAAIDGISAAGAVERYADLIRPYATRGGPTTNDAATKALKSLER